MSLEQQLQEILREIAATPSNNLSWRDVVHLIDLTLLDEKAAETDIINLAQKAERYQVAAICVYPSHLRFVPNPSKIKLATVANFPSGNQPQDTVISMLEEIIANEKVSELDYVFPYQAYLEGQHVSALQHCEQCYQFCNQHGVLFKVILETGAFPSMDKIYQASTDIIRAGCDFLKTSTGKIEAGATIPAAFAMLSAINDVQPSCGIKLSGGIKTTQQAFDYIYLAQYQLNRPIDNTCFRLGASSLLDDLLQYGERNESKNY